MNPTTNPLTLRNEWRDFGSSLAAVGSVLGDASCWHLRRPRPQETFIRPLSLSLPCDVFEMYHRVAG